MEVGPAGRQPADGTQPKHAAAEVPRRHAPVTAAVDRPPTRPGRRRGPARPAAARHPRGRAPLPVRQPRRGRHRAAAARRHAVPTTYYLTCPRAASLIGTLEGSGLMREMEDRLGERRRPGRGVRRRRTSAYLADRARSSATCRRSPASPPAACPTGSSACTCSPARRWPQGRGVNPLGDEVLERLGAWWADGPVRRAGADDGVTPDRRDRLRHQHHQAPGRRPRRDVAGPRVADGPARAGRRPHRPARRRGAGAHVRRHRRVRRADRGARRDADPLLRHLRHPRRRATPTSSPTGSASGSASRPRCCPAPRRRRWSSTGAVAPPAATPVDGAGPRRRHRRRLDRAGPRRRTRPGRRRVSMDIGSVRLHERHLHDDPPTAEQVAACVADIDRAPRRRAGVDARPRRAHGGRDLAGTVKTLAAGDARPAGLRPRRDRRRASSATGVTACVRRAAGRDDRRRAPRAAVHAPRPRRRDRRRRADLVAGAAPGRGRRRYRVSEADILVRHRLARWPTP